MKQSLQKIHDLVTATAGLSADERASVIGMLNAAGKKFNIQAAKAACLEQEKKALYVSLQITIDELEEKSEMVKERNRDLEIGAALERVRSRTMAMKKSEELHEVIQLVFEQLQQLNFDIDVANFALNYKDTNDFDLSLAVRHGEYPMKIHVPYIQHPVFDRFNQAKEKEGLLVDTLSKDEKDSFFKHFFKYVPGVPEETKLSIFDRPGFVRSSALMKNTALTIHNYNGVSYSDAENNILMRFGQVFDQTFTRFNDLKQAEEQARESQIQLGLERVRAKAMSMQTSEGLNELIGTVFSELTKLDFVLTRCLIMIFDRKTRASRWWMANSELPAEPVNYLVQNHKNPAYDAYLEAWEEQNLKFRYALKGQVKRDWDDFLFVYTELAQLPGPVIEGMKAPEQVLLSASFNNFGCLTLVTTEPLLDEHSEIMLRFAKVFDMCYTRFNDLKQAEAQARESRIEAALEKVRGKALAMYSSTDLSATASMVFTELRKLGIDPIRCGVGMMNGKSRKVALYSATKAADGDSLGLLGLVMLAGHPVSDKIYESLLQTEDYFPVLKGKQLKAYYKNLLSGLSLPALADFHPGDVQYGHFFPFSDGCLYAWAGRAYNDAEVRVLKRFGSVIDLTFRRYTELQRSEASAREAVRAASLDRVRAEIASMRSTDDLERITPLIWNELTILGIPFIRCGVFIIDEQAELIYTHLSTADGRAISTFNLPFNSDGIGREVLAAWRAKEIARIHWTAEEFADYTRNLLDRGTVTPVDRYVTEHPDISLDLHFAPFLQGMLYVGNITPLTADELGLVQSLAEAFSTAYARYEDFNRLETAKRQVENALTDLKATQTRLIQSEKMASLGELTAGIAHEIQNPLNFVNNFSDVNRELLEELKAENQKPKAERDEQLEADLINDLIENEQKINHHGKRADGIVKGMLQHSRTGGGEKQPTNINALADEFMRLSYHGLRAKDKMFNAELVTEFDPNLPKVSVSGQDIGRALLNLFNNAFYAVNQKNKGLDGNFKPQVSVTTMTENGLVAIKVKDNGVGMSEHVREKIMQPFFTTKPTGEGTGLGLSLTYDMVVKGHGGSIQVDSIEGEGSEFIIQLPIN